MCNLMYVYVHARAHTHTYGYHGSLTTPWEEPSERHMMTRVTGSDCAVMCNNLINTHVHREGREA